MAFSNLNRHKPNIGTYDIRIFAVHFRMPSFGIRDTNVHETVFI